MDIKQNSTMIIALAIAIVVVMSVMVPVISDTMDNADSSNGGGIVPRYIPTQATTITKRSTLATRLR